MPDSPLYEAQRRVTETRVAAEKSMAAFLAAFRPVAEAFAIADADQQAHVEALKMQERLLSHSKTDLAEDEDEEGEEGEGPEDAPSNRSQTRLRVLNYVDSQETATAKEIMAAVGIPNNSYFTYHVNHGYLEWVPNCHRPRRLRLTLNGKTLLTQAKLDRLI